jgi:histone H3/H4
VATIVKAHGKSLKIAAEAKSLLRVAAEAFLTGIFEDSKVVMMHSNRSTLFPEHVHIVKKLRGAGSTLFPEHVHIVKKLRRS